MYIHGYYYNQNDEKISVHILTHGDRSEEVEIGVEGDDLYFTDDPVELTTQVNDTWDHLLCNQASIRLLTRNYVPDFFCPSCRDAVVNIYREDTCLFAGFIEPQTYSQGYNEEYDEVELTCVDTLIALQYSRYRDIGSLGVLYSVVKAEAEQRTFWSIMKEMLDDIASGIDILGTGKVRYLYDGSKAMNSTSANRHTILRQLSINELLFLGKEEDDVWQQNEVLEEMLKYLNLHIVQDGMTFYVFSWETVKSEESIYWRDLESSERLPMGRRTTDITTQNVTDTDTTISVGEIFNQIQLTCSIESMESVIESPLDDDLLVSPYSNKQKYMTEYSSHGEGSSAIKAFDAMTHGQDTDYGAGSITDWYIQVMNNPQWLFPNKGKGNLMEEYCADGTNQHALPNLLRQQTGAAIIVLGKVEKKTDGKDNAPVGKINMTNYLVVSVNGNGNDTESGTYPTVDSLQAGIPCAVYRGSTTGGTFSPTDEDTTNYIVLSGKIVLNPLMKLTDTFTRVYDYNPTKYSYPLSGASGIYQFWHQTVPSRDNGDGRYYTQRWYAAEVPSEEATWDQTVDAGLVPFTGTGPEEFEFNYSAVGDSSDQISKISVLACMLIIGDKCVVETGTNGQVSDFEWRPYKTLEECNNNVDTYYQQCFTIGFDPKIKDKLIGTKFDMQNNISYELGIDAEGIAIPIKKSDKLTGRVEFKILGPVNVMWDEITRRHKTWFRRTKWRSSSKPLLAHVSSIFLESFEVKIYSDNGLVNNTGDNDIIYMSDTRESFVNKKDDIEFKISSALTSAESRALGVTDSVKMSTPMNTLTQSGVLTIYDYARKEEAKPEQLYVDSYYSEYHKPRVEMTQKLSDREGGIINFFDHYRHPYMGKTFFVEGISRNLTSGEAEMKLKEIES